MDIGQFFGGDGTLQGYNRQNIILRKLGRALALSSSPSPVQQAVVRIVLPRTPRKMLRGDASKMTIGAGMPRYLDPFGRRPIRSLAHNSMHIRALTLMLYPAVTLRFCEGPEQTFIPIVWDRHSLQKLSRVPSIDNPLKGVPMTVPPIIMRRAPTSDIAGRLVAFWNRAYRFVSHFDLLERLAWLGLRSVTSTVAARASYTQWGA